MAPSKWGEGRWVDMEGCGRGSWTEEEGLLNRRISGNGHVLRTSRHRRHFLCGLHHRTWTDNGPTDDGPTDDRSADDRPRGGRSKVGWCEWC